jgi:hypothetical protein
MIITPTRSQIIRQRLILAVLPSTLLLTGCTLNPFAPKAVETLPPVGIYKSLDRGDTWTPKNNILAVGTSRPSLNETNVNSLILDPTDHETIYMGGVGQGLFVSNNGAESWLQSKSIRSGSIVSLAMPTDPKLRCTTFIAAENKILRTTDCARSWEQVYQDTRPRVTVPSVAINSLTPTTIYAATSTGDILKSLDNGINWATIGRFKDDVLMIVPHPLKPDTIYIALKNKGFQQTEDGGTTWLDLGADLKKYAGANRITSVLIDPSRPETVIISSKFGLLRTTDGGKTWEPIPLLTAIGTANIVSVAINPKNSEQIYYTTETTLYRSNDAGKTWETKPLPVTGVRTILLIDPEKPETFYLGVNRPAKKSAI